MDDISYRQEIRLRLAKAATATDQTEASRKMAQRDSERAARRNTATAAVALGLIAMAMLLVTLWRTW
jgi:hypothetical protein